MRRIILCCSLSVLFLISTLLIVAPIRAAATITVTTLLDVIDHTDGVCSLREAIIAANTDTGAADCAAGSGADTIVFDAGLAYPGSIVLTIPGTDENAALTGDLDLSGTLIISGPGSSLLAIDGNQLDRVFEVLGGARVSMTGLQITHGDAGANSGGGFAVNSTGVLTLTNSRVISNVATYGGGVWVGGRLNATHSEIALNHNGGIFNAGGAVILSNAQILSNTQGYGIWNEGALVFSGGALKGNAGGGLHNSGSPAPSASLSDVSVIGNTGGSGIYNVSGSTTVVRSQILSNTGVSGGGIYNGDVFASPSINIQDSQIGYNVASVNGGGVFNYNFLTLRTSTLFHNHAASGGGLHYNAASGLTLMNVTFSNNAASDNGGAIYNKRGVTLVNVTLADNTAGGQGGAIFNDGAQSWSKNTILFGNIGTDGTCAGDAGTHISQGYNLGDDATCNLTATGDITGSNPLLGPLQDNGGFTWTRALLAGSPAIDHATNTGCPTTDQRGLPRPQNGVCDIGAYEEGNLPPSYTLTTSTAGNGSGTVTRSPNQPAYFAGTIVTLTATPNTGSNFSGWSGSIGGTTNPITITMDADKVMTAAFDLMTYTLTISTVGGGVVVHQPDQSSYPYGSQVALTATANLGYSFAGWSGSATGFANPLWVTMIANKVITATFVLGQLPIADAGLPQTVKSLTLVTLDGSNSYDPDNNLPLVYDWHQIGGEAVIMSNPVISRSTFTAPGVTSTQVLIFSLVVTDAMGLASIPAEVTITVESFRCLLPVVLR